VAELDEILKVAFWWNDHAASGDDGLHDERSDVLSAEVFDLPLDVLQAEQIAAGIRLAKIATVAVWRTEVLEP